MGDSSAGLDVEPVGVIVPCYNAGATLDQTLRSIRSQTWSALDILVVDDGSTDSTREVAERHAAADPRIRVISQPNRGVAAARNLGIAHTNARYVAPIDADDLWVPAKIERQMQAVNRFDGELGLVYTWFYMIDEQGKIRFREYRGSAEGFVLEHICRRNVVGNGSNALILRKAIEEIGGYNTLLRELGAQGAEDYQMFLRIAEKYEFALVREYLTGYREASGNMSGNVDQMVKSHAYCMADFTARHPDLKHAALEGRTRFLRFMAARSWREGNHRTAMHLLLEMVSTGLLRTVSSLAELVRDRWHRRVQLRKEGPGPAFFQIGRVSDASESN